MKKLKLSETDQVSQHITHLNITIQPAIEYLRQVMLSIDPEISEHLKWNSPSFYYSGQMKDFHPNEYKRDILVVNLRLQKIMCIMPTGMNIKVNTEILEGDYTDGRRIINFTNLDDIKQKEVKLRKAIKEWLSLIEK